MNIELLKIIANIFAFILTLAVIIYYLPVLFEIDEKPETEGDYKREFYILGHKITIEKEKISK